jgi:hypothetical protein
VTMTIIDALRDPRMFGALPAFRDLRTWRRWLVFLAAFYGLPLSALRDVGVAESDALRIFCEHTQRATYRPPFGGHPEGVAITGRQSGKTRMGGTVTTFDATTGAPEPDGTEIYSLLIAQDERSALRTSFSYAVAPFDLVPALRAMVPTGWRSLWKKARKADSLTLVNGHRIGAYPARPAAPRGLRASSVVVDEIEFMRSSEGRRLDVEMLRAVRPTLATTGGKLLILSSPYGQTGALFDLHRRHFGRDDSTTLVWQASAPAMNPTLSADYLERMRQDDPDAYRSEVLGEFRAGVSTFFDGAALTACIAEGVRERAPVAGVAYVGDYDASGGRNDAAAVSIAHAERDLGVQDAVRAWPAPHNPAAVIAEASRLLRRYGVSAITGDRYAGEFPVAEFRQHGIELAPRDRDRSGLYLDLLPLVNAGRVSLLDDAETLRELRGLERRRGSAGRDRVDHPVGGHDDRANVVAGALVRAAGDGAGMPWMLVGGGAWRDWEARQQSRRVDTPVERGVKKFIADALAAYGRGDEAFGDALLTECERFIESQPDDVRARLTQLVDDIESKLMEARDAAS